MTHDQITDAVRASLTLAPTKSERREESATTLSRGTNARPAIHVESPPESTRGESRSWAVTSGSPRPLSRRAAA